VAQSQTVSDGPTGEPHQQEDDQEIPSLTGAIATGRGRHPFNSLTDAVRQTRKFRTMQGRRAVGAAGATGEGKAD
jgi:hypothetical protein